MKNREFKTTLGYRLPIETLYREREREREREERGEKEDGEQGGRGKGE
jgi:hypothetical protein